jgi:hypothetical protein
VTRLAALVSLVGSGNGNSGSTTFVNALTPAMSQEAGREFSESHGMTQTQDPTTLTIARTVPPSGAAISSIRCSGSHSCHTNPSFLFLRGRERERETVHPRKQHDCRFAWFLDLRWHVPVISMLLNVVHGEVSKRGSSHSFVLQNVPICARASSTTGQISNAALIGALVLSDQ